METGCMRTHFEAMLTQTFFPAIIIIYYYYYFYYYYYYYYYHHYYYYYYYSCYLFVAHCAHFAEASDTQHTLLLLLLLLLLILVITSCIYYYCYYNVIIIITIIIIKTRKPRGIPCGVFFFFFLFKLVLYKTDTRRICSRADFPFLSCCSSLRRSICRPFGSRKKKQAGSGRKLTHNIYIYIYMYVYIHLSLSLYIYIYIYTQKCTHVNTTNDKPQ